MEKNGENKILKYLGIIFLIVIILIVGTYFLARDQISRLSSDFYTRNLENFESKEPVRKRKYTR